MEKEKLLKELHDAFNQTKARLKFKSSFEEIDSICFLEDFIFSQKYVSNSFSRQMINRLMDTFYSWMPNLHSWIFPQNYDAVFSNESKQFSQQEKNEI